jgi:hypothetical protein
VRAEGTIDPNDHPRKISQPFNHGLMKQLNPEQSENGYVGLGFETRGPAELTQRAAHGWARVGNLETKEDQNRLI